MAEAADSVQQANVRASMGIATNVLARQRALNHAKDQLRRQGLRVSSFTHRELVLKAEAYLAEHRAELMAEASVLVDRWREEGFFGKRARDAVQRRRLIRTVGHSRRAKHMAKPRLKLVTPATVNRTVIAEAASQRRAAEVGAPHRGRGRAAYGSGQGQPVGSPGQHHGPRRLPARPTGFRAGRPPLWDQVDFRTATLHVRRVKKGTPSTHPILGDELRALRRLQREQEPKSPFVFTSERGAPFTTAGFARMVERAGSEAKLGFKAHPHMLRHACGYALANKGPRHEGTASLSGASQHPAYGALFRIGPDAVQGLLALSARQQSATQSPSDRRWCAQRGGGTNPWQHSASLGDATAQIGRLWLVWAGGLDQNDSSFGFLIDGSDNGHHLCRRPIPRPRQLDGIEACLTAVLSLYADFEHVIAGGKIMGVDWPNFASGGHVESIVTVNSANLQELRNSR